MIDYRKELEESSEKEYAEFIMKLTPGREDVIGVRLPKLRAIAKEIIKDDWRSFLDEKPLNFEETMIRCLVISTAKMDTDERIELTKSFIPLVNTWSLCDTLCSSWKVSKKDSGTAYEYFASLIGTDEEFPMRASLVFRMNHFMDDDHIDMLLDDIGKKRNEGFYYKMGAAWVISDCYIHYPEKTIDLLKSGKLDAWTHNKSIQKIRESFRVSDEEKECLKYLRR